MPSNVFISAKCSVSGDPFHAHTDINMNKSHANSSLLTIQFVAGCVVDAVAVSMAFKRYNTVAGTSLPYRFDVIFTSSCTCQMPNKLETDDEFFTTTIFQSDCDPNDWNEKKSKNAPLELCVRQLSAMQIFNIIFFIVNALCYCNQLLNSNLFLFSRGCDYSQIALLWMECVFFTIVIIRWRTPNTELTLLHLIKQVAPWIDFQISKMKSGKITSHKYTHLTKCHEQQWTTYRYRPFAKTAQLILKWMCQFRWGNDKLWTILPACVVVCGAFKWTYCVSWHIEIVREKFWRTFTKSEKYPRRAF